MNDFFPANRSGSIKPKLGRNSQKFVFHCIYRRKIKKRGDVVGDYVVSHSFYPLARIVGEIEGRIFQEFGYDAKVGAFEEFGEIEARFIWGEGVLGGARFGCARWWTRKLEVREGYDGQQNR